MRIMRVPATTVACTRSTWNPSLKYRRRKEALDRGTIKKIQIKINFITDDESSDENTTVVVDQNGKRQNNFSQYTFKGV